MTKGPNVERRPADAIACAVPVLRIATGEDDGTGYVSKNRRNSGVAGAKARNESLAAEQRLQNARAANAARKKGGSKMLNNIDMAKNRLYGAGGLMVADVKLFPGGSADVTPNQRAEQVNKIMAQLEAGDFDVVTEYED